MSTNENRPLDEIAAFRDVPEYHDPVEPSFAPELRPGHLLDGRFLLGEPLSRSGMAIIYKAEDKLNQNRPVAVKVPHLKYEADPNFFDRFRREEDIGQKLDHPFLLKFIPVDGKSRPYIVTEYISGCTLQHLLNAMRPLPEKDALRIASLLCEALQYMHEHGVIHRDLKPGNIMICRDRTIRLLDFGLASSADFKRITVTGFSPAMGTPDYMAPEQVKNERCDERTDIYSLGVILYEMLTGVLPFQHENPWVAMNNRVNGDPPAPRKINPEISPQAEEIVLHAMQRDPANRYPSAAAMKAELDAPRSVQVTGYAEHLQAPRWRIGMRETPVIAGTLIALGVISLQVLGFFLFRLFLSH
ncbi:MAG TPA: serine/threonine-protein kinase [Candidatus Dormibacteraeota bacterium]|nr:serine/threonine-protein kinase [Candidatus Dormibacteraeota bacterium]